MPQTNCSLGGNAHTAKLKWCEYCNIFRPLRVSHCHDCNNCVLGFDHHCVWLGTCIGKRNYSVFFSFICSTSTFIVYLLVVSIMMISRETSVALSNTALLAMFICFLCVVFGIMLIGLTGGHLIFMCYYKKTTNEALKKSEKYGYKMVQY